MLSLMVSRLLAGTIYGNLRTLNFCPMAWSSGCRLTQDTWYLWLMTHVHFAGLTVGCLGCIWKSSETSAIMWTLRGLLPCLMIRVSLLLGRYFELPLFLLSIYPRQRFVFHCFSILEAWSCHPRPPKCSGPSYYRTSLRTPILRRLLQAALYYYDVQVLTQDPIQLLVYFVC
jgi:hypothetical protein